MLSERLTIVIPCKNEQGYISHLLHDIAQQYDIKGTKIIIADSSDDSTLEVVNEFKIRYFDFLDIEIVQGGRVSEARNNGARLVKTPFTLFLDADVRLPHTFHLIEAYLKARGIVEKRGRALVTSSLGSYALDWKCEASYKIYNVAHRLLTKKYPFAIGAFFLVDTESFRRFGTFDTLVDNSEDFLFSQHYKSKEFYILDYKIMMDDRRFKKIGYLGFAKHLIVNFYKYLTNQKKHFYKNVGYWG